MNTCFSNCDGNKNWHEYGFDGEQRRNNAIWKLPTLKAVQCMNDCHSSCDETFHLFIYLNRMNGWQNVIADERIVFDMCAIFCHRTQYTHKMKWNLLRNAGDGNTGGRKNMKIERHARKRQRKKCEQKIAKKKRRKFTDDRTRAFPKLAALRNEKRQRAEKREREKEKDVRVRWVWSESCRLWEIRI